MQGMGGFLNPPGHPEHKQSVETDLRRRPENRGWMSLSTAVDCEWLDAATRRVAKTVLASWERSKLPLDNAEVQDWIRQVLGYFTNCYRRAGSEAPDAWNCDKLEINKAIDPFARLDDHAGVHLIRKYYPEFTPTPEHFAEAYWGRKPATTEIKQRLEYLRGELRAERISYEELAELQSLAPHIEPGDVELLEAAGIPESDKPN